MQNDEVQSGQSIHKLGYGISGDLRHQRCSEVGEYARKMLFPSNERLKNA